MSDANFELMGRRSSSDSGPASSDANLEPAGPVAGSNSGSAGFLPGLGSGRPGLCRVQ